MSTTYTNAYLASQEFNGKVEVIDSRTLSTGMALQAIYARKLTETESSVQVIAEKVRARTDKVQASFVIEKLDYLEVFKVYNDKMNAIKEAGILNVILFVI